MRFLPLSLLHGKHGIYPVGRLVSQLKRKHKIGNRVTKKARDMRLVNHNNLDHTCAPIMVY